MMRGVMLTATVLALIPLVLIIYYLLKKGLGSFSSSALERLNRSVGPGCSSQRNPRLSVSLRFTRQLS